MVEGPEIRKMSDRMNYIVGQTLSNIRITKHSRYQKTGIRNINFIKRNEKIRKLFVIGKKIFIRLKTYIIIFNMAMDGTLTPYKDQYNTMTFVLSNTIFYMNDKRNFGTIIVDNLNTLKSYIDKLGYDPIYHRSWSHKHVYNRFISPFRSKQPLAKKLMDQRIFAGIGNYLRAEILYDSRIDPECKFDNLPYNFWSKIIGSYRKKYTESYEEYIIMRAYKRKDNPNIISRKVRDRTLWYDPHRVKYFC